MPRGPHNGQGGRGRSQVGSGLRDQFGPPERSGLVRGVVIVVLAVVIGALVMPSATRAPLAVVTTRVAAGTPRGSSSTTTSLPARSSTTTTTTPAHAGIHVLVANATSVNGVAGSVTTFLGGKGFATLTAANALVKLTASRIYFTASGSAAAADEVASALSLASSTVQPASAVPSVLSAAGASVVVIAGADLAARFAPASTTTTASH